MKVKAEIGVMLLQAKEHQRLPANSQKPGERQGTDSPLKPTEGTNPTNTLILDFQPPELWENTFLWLKPLCYGSPGRGVHFPPSSFVPLPGI